MGKLSREAVVDQALEIGSAEGLQAVTIRRLAQELGVTPMALYWHFKNKEQLIIGMADHLVEGFVITEDYDRPWQEQLRELVAGLIKVLRRYPCAAAVLEEVDHITVPSFLRVWDTGLGLAKQAGFSYEESCLISRYLLQGAIALAAGPTDRRPGLSDQDAAEHVRVKRVGLQSLPPDVYPHIVEMAAPLCERGTAEFYDTFGVDLLVTGIETLAARLHRD
ncbi:transcriptional regulator, TetR family [Streptosporangium canum]|uniref:Transcriptional regulator, TetR family n=1 Tax=Streptosporangium canum TaxID=324952 RepID=A0A1I4D4J9_9ACTN|nr:TetR family transcriptional regulator [Streptosporangium canum]SFK88508.1 transcriptional regulator, TetR family [Streptosporangium canum]